MAKKSKINIADLRGLANLLQDSTIGVTDLVQDMHTKIVHPTSFTSTPIQKLITRISGVAYNNVRLAAKLIGGGLDKTLAQFNPGLEIGISLEKKETIVAIINGVAGDYLSKNKNPLSISMQFRYHGETVFPDRDSFNKTYPKINGKILLIAHGLCMNDIQWTRKNHNHGETLASLLDMTPLYLYYNSGLHISTNGKNFNNLLEELVKNWPVPVEAIVILAHSMGGLLSRSAYHYAEKEKKTWINYLGKIIFLGSPHHGAPLERIGNYIDQTFESAPYVKPFARLAKIRSAGITDLRFGNLLDDDWATADRFEKQPDNRTHIALPANANCFSVAATMGKTTDDYKYQILGDGLVPLDSALGKHKDPTKNLNFRENNVFIAHGHNHMDLLSSKIIFEQIKKWME